MLPDLLEKNLNIVICGTGVGNKSAEKEFYYAGPGNQFYTILNKIGLTPNLISPQSYTKLLNYNIGLTDLVKNKSGMDKIHKSSDYDVVSFVQKVKKYKPKILCFNGKKAAKEYFGLRKTKFVEYGLQNIELVGTKLFVAPSTSGTARRYWDEDYWFQLKKLI